jgi:hypothetical protein
MDPLRDLLDLDSFRIGLVCSAIAALGVAAVVLVGRRERPWAGLAFAAAALVALDDRFTVEAGFAVGVVLVAVGGCLAARRGPMVQVVAAVPGTLVLAQAADLDTPGWAVPTIVGVTLIGGVLVAACDRPYGRLGATPVMLAVTTLGIYLTTPDTEHTALLLGAALPVALLGWPRPVASLGVGGSFAAVALLAWAVVVDGAGRDGAVIGAVACLGLFAVEPLVRWAGARDVDGRGAVSGRQALVAVALHVGVVAVCSRVGGLRESAADALVICAVAYAVSAAALVLASRRFAAVPA